MAFTRRVHKISFDQCSLPYNDETLPGRPYMAYMRNLFKWVNVTTLQMKRWKTPIEVDSAKSDC